jgi:hypothetical protein
LPSKRLEGSSSPLIKACFSLVERLRNAPGNSGCGDGLLLGSGGSTTPITGVKAPKLPCTRAPSGRADDFGWPRGVVNVEPAAAESAAPDTAAADAGAKSAKPAQRKSAMDAYAAQTGREQKPAIRRSTSRSVR